MKESKTLVNIGSKIEVSITDLSSEGFGIGRIDGIVVFVDGALPGEKISAIVSEGKKNYITAKLAEIIIPSPNRQEPFCPVFEKCGGCSLQHMSYSSQLDYKEKKVKDAVERISGLKNVQINKIIGTKQNKGYRNKVQFFFDYKNNEVNCGFFGRKSHNVINNYDCFLINDTANRLKNEFVAFIKKNISEFYEIKDKTAILKSIIIRQAFKANELMLIIISSRRMNKKLTESFMILFDDLTRKIPELKSMYYSVNADPADYSLNNKIMHLTGSNSLIETIEDLRFKISPGSFFQINTFSAEKLYSKIAELADLRINETALDLFCGTGTIGLFLAERAGKVYGIDIIESSIKDAKENAKMNKIRNTEFVRGDVSKFLETYISNIDNSINKPGIGKIDVVAIDPPREGLGDKLVSLISKLNAEKLIYVSCNASTLARDLKSFDILGYDVKEINPIDMFPHTVHVECCCLLSRTDK